MMADGRTIVVRGELVIGRVAGCDVVLDDTKASRRHARLIVEAGVVEIEDLGSSNGTLLNGKTVTRRVLRPGDEVQIGSHVLFYCEGALPTASAAGPATPTATPAAAPPASTDSDELFGDDDLFAGAAPAAAPPPPAPTPAPTPAPPRAAAPSAPPPSRVVEFADEIVEVKKREAPAAKKGPAPAAATEMVQQPRILQFNKKDNRGGVLGDDLAQMGGGMKALVYALVLALGVGVAYGLITYLR